MLKGKLLLVLAQLMLTLELYNREEEAAALDQDTETGMIRSLFPMGDMVEIHPKVEDQSVDLDVVEDSGRATTETTWLAQLAATAEFSTQPTECED